MTGLARLEAFATVVGRGITPRYATDGTFTVFNQKCVRDGSVSSVAARRHDATTRPVPANKRLSSGDCLVNSTGQGTLGRTGYVRGVEGAATVDSHITIVRPHPTTDSRWLAYALRMLEPSIEDLAIGSTGQTELPRDALASLPIPNVAKAEQQAIAEVLGALDDKIAANTAFAATAESFSASIAATAPASVPLGSLAELSKQQLHPESLGDQFVDHFSLPAFDAGALPSTELASAIKSSKFVLTEESVLLSKLNPRFPRVWRAAPASRPALASTEFLVLRSPEVTTRLLWASISDPTFAKALDARVAGTSGSHQRVKPADALTVKIRDPRALPERAQSLIEHVLRAASLAREESRTLAATRDALLPQLMSGKLRVRDAIRAAKAVV